MRSSLSRLTCLCLSISAIDYAVWTWDRELIQVRLGPSSDDRLDSPAHKWDKSGKKKRNLTIWQKYN